MLINEKEIKLRLDLGAMKKFQELTGKNFLAIGEEQMTPDMLAAMIYSFAIRGGSDITMDDVDSMTMEQIVALQDEIAKLTGDKKSGNPPKVSRQK